MKNEEFLYLLYIWEEYWLFFISHSLFFIYLFLIFRAVRIFPKKEYCFNYLVIFASRTTDI